MAFLNAPEYPIPGIGKNVKSKEQKEAFEEIVKEYPAARWPVNQAGLGKEEAEAAKKEGLAEEKKAEEKKEEKAEEKPEEALIHISSDENPYSKYVGNVGSRSKVHDNTTTLWEDLDFSADGPQRHTGYKEG